MRYAIIVLLGIVGLIVGFTWGYVSESGFFRQWHQLPSSPSKISELITVSDGTLFVKTVDGSVLQCSSYKNECWVPGKVSEIDEGWTKITKPCDLSSSEFSFLTRPPKHIAACIQGATQYAEALGRETYLMDTDGNVWEWHLISGGLGLSLTFCASISCAILGGIIGLGSLLIRRKRHSV
jgi:hypothetical protein